MQTNKIEMHKKYRTRSGLPVRVLCVDRKDLVAPVVALVDENGEEFSIYVSKDGHYYYFYEKEQHPFDLIEVSEWDDFNMDDKVLVSEVGVEWEKRYFYKVIDGRAYCFDRGLTSWVLNDKLNNDPLEISSPWKFCKKAEV